MSATLSTLRQPIKGGIWPALNRLMIVTIVLLVGTILGQRFLPEVGKRKEAEAKRDALQAMIDVERQRSTRLNREVALLQTDPEYIGLIARDRLDLMKEGEMIYRVENPRDPGRMRRVP